MRFIDIYPFVRFSAKQNFSKDISYLRNETIGYDHRIYYCVKGRGNLNIDDNVFSLEPYSLVIWQAGHTYKFLPEEGEDFICMTCNFDYTNANCEKAMPIIPSSKVKFIERNIIEHVFFDDFDNFNKIIFIKSFPQISELMNSLINTYKAKLRYYQIYLRSYLLQILLLTSIHIGDSEAKENREKISEIIKYIQHNYQRSISNKEIAKSFSYHPNYISNLFVKETGYSLHNYLIRYRLAKAFDYLMSSNMPINRICEEINIPDCLYFSKIFKKYYGLSPQKARKNTH